MYHKTKISNRDLINIYFRYTQIIYEECKVDSSEYLPNILDKLETWLDANPKYLSVQKQLIANKDPNNVESTLKSFEMGLLSRLSSEDHKCLSELVREYNQI